MISGVEASPGSVGENGQRQQNQVWSLVITGDSIMNVFALDKFSPELFNSYNIIKPLFRKQF